MQLLVILVPVVFAFMGFAVDLARLYLIRGELQTAANSAALAAASRLLGIDAALTQAADQAKFSFDAENGFANKYDFGAVTIGEGTGFLNSEEPSLTFFETMAAATGDGEGGEASGATAKYAKVTITADAPLLFFSFLPIASERKTPIQISAVAGVSAPLCTACGIEPIALAALDPADLVDFGFVKNTRYTLGYVCNGTPTPSGVAGAQRVEYMMLNRYNEEATLYPDETSQAFRIGAQGMLPTAATDNSTDPATFPRRACITVTTDEVVWVNAAPLNCNANRVPGPVSAFTCGLSMRFDTAVQANCANIGDVDAIAALYQVDTDITDLEDYAAYAGNGRRIITVAIVETLSTGPVQALGFRQFLIQPDTGSTTVNAGDSNGRFVASYIGSVMPLKQGRFDGCQLAAGPGKVVLHR
jgi:hypothetical protein